MSIKPTTEQSYAASVHRQVLASPTVNKNRKISACIVCNAAPSACELVHVYPLKAFALYFKPGTIEQVSMCSQHHMIFDTMVNKYLDGRPWRKEAWDSFKNKDEYITIEQLVYQVVHINEKIQNRDLPKYKYSWL